MTTPNHHPYLAGVALRAEQRRAAKRARKCDPCGGLGSDLRNDDGPCGWCRGSGEVEAEAHDVDGDEIKLADERDIVRGLWGRL